MEENTSTDATGGSPEGTTPSANTQPGKDEINIILQTVEEGLFFLNSDFELDAEYSDALEGIIDQKVIAGQSFLDILTNRVPENIINNSIEFLNLLFREDLDNETLGELNPLKRVEFHFENRWGLWTSSKFLSFRFKRVEDSSKIQRVVCTIRDTTKGFERSQHYQDHI